MREKAKERGIYKRLDEFWMEKEGETDRLKIRNSFDAVSCIGVFMQNTVSPNGIFDLIDMVKRGGFIVVNFRNDYDKEFGFSRMTYNL